MPPSGAPRWLREPVLHFLLVGAVLFALDHARSRDEQPAGGTRIEVTPAVRADLLERWRTTRGVEPSPEELAREIETWKDEEVLYREGLRRGLDRDDPAVRDRIARKMAQAVAATVVLPEPTEEDLRAWHAAHPALWQKAERVDFTHVFVDGSDDDARARAAALQEQLMAGADPARLGDTFQGGRRYRGRKLDDLAASFGDTFASAIRSAASAQPPTRDWRVVASRFGWHVVRLDGRTAAETPPFEQVRDDVHKSWQDHRREVLRAEAIAALRARWTIVDAP